MGEAETELLEADGAGSADEAKVTPLELFFDLVFVFAFTQVTFLMAEKPTWTGLGEGMLVLAAVWWGWGAYAWLTNALHSDDGLARFGLLSAMAAMLIAALAVPGAFSRRRGDLRRRLLRGPGDPHRRLHLRRARGRRSAARSSTSPPGCCWRRRC